MTNKRFDKWIWYSYGTIYGTICFIEEGLQNRSIFQPITKNVIMTRESQGF